MSDFWVPIRDRASLPRVGTEESEILDFKRVPWDPGDGGYLELARDVAQFANHLGGSIIVGADEDGQDHLSGYVHVTDAAGVAARIQDVCHSALSPRVDLDARVLEQVPGVEVVLVNVPAHDGVVAIKLRGVERWEFYRRVGKCKKPFSFGEVEQMWTDGRKGRVLLAKIPVKDLNNVFVDVVEGHGIHLKGPFAIILREDYFTFVLSRPGPVFNLPYECVRAAWPSANGGWSVALDAHVALDPGGQMRVKYTPK